MFVVQPKWSDTMSKSIRSRVYDELRMWTKDKKTGLPTADEGLFGVETINRLLRLLYELHEDYCDLEAELADRELTRAWYGRSLGARGE